MDLNAFLQPRTIALVGASEDDRLARDLHANLQKSLSAGFRGRIHYVHPRSEIVLGQRCFANLNDIPGPVDLAFLVGPWEETPDRIDDCAAKGVGAAWLFSTPPHPDGDDATRAWRRAIEERARANRVAIAGPGALGYVNLHRALLPFGLPLPDLERGAIGLAFQSGELIVWVLRALASRAIGVACAVSTGDEVALAVPDYVDCMLDMDEVRVVGAVLDRPVDARRFAAVFDHAARAGKPIVILRLGRRDLEASGLGSRAGSADLPTTTEVSSALFRQRGVVEVRSVDELIECCNLFAHHRVPAGPRVAMVAISDGACGSLAEIARDAGLLLPEPEPDLAAKLLEAVPDTAPPLNPLDLAGDLAGRTARFVAASELLAGIHYDAVVYAASTPYHAEYPYDGVLARVRHLRALAERVRKPLIPLQMVTEGLPPFARTLATEEGIHYLQGAENGLRALAAAIRWGEFQRRYEQWDGVSASHVLFPFDARRRALELLEGLADGVLDEAISRQLLSMYGVPLVPAGAATTADEAAEAAKRLGFPVALKALCAGLPNRQKAGAVALELGDDSSVRVAFDQVVDAARRSTAHDVRGVIVSRMVRGGVPVRCAAFRDPLWGPVVLVGGGGEEPGPDDDIALRVWPTSHAELRGMLAETRVSRRLAGWAGRPPADRNALLDLLERLALLMQDLSDRLVRIELNPVAVFPAGGGCFALDALVTKGVTRG